MLRVGGHRGHPLETLRVDILDSVRDHYWGLWGEPSRTAEFTESDYTVEVNKWSSDTNPEGVDLYATIGASANPAPQGDPTHRVEFFLGLLPGRDDIASPLAALALFPIREGKPLDHGHTVPAEAPLWRGTEMQRFLIMKPITEIIPPLVLPRGVHVEFLQALPIFESELTYKVEHGAEKLIQLWERNGVRFWDPDRPSAVT